ncbi:Bromodomain-containing protein [Entamoeba marina]
MHSLSSYIVNGVLPISSFSQPKFELQPLEIHENSLFKNLYSSDSHDYEFEIDSKKVKVHKFVLSSRIPFFHQYFSLEEQPKLEITAQQLNSLVDWCYFDNTDVDVQTILEVLHFCMLHQITEPVEYYSYKLLFISNEEILSGKGDKYIEQFNNFFSNDIHRRYFSKLFEKVSKLVIIGMIKSGNVGKLEPLLPYYLLPVHNSLGNTRKKKVTKVQHKQSEHDFSRTLLHQTTKPKKTTTTTETKKIYPLNKQNTKLISNFINTTFKQKQSEAFRYPVDPIANNAPNYREIIKHPMDISTIKQKLKDKSYENVNEIIEDFRLIWNNAFTYNSQGSVVYKLAKDVSESFEKRLEKVVFEED